MQKNGHRYADLERTWTYSQRVCVLLPNTPASDDGHASLCPSYVYCSLATEYEPRMGNGASSPSTNDYLFFFLNSAERAWAVSPSPRASIAAVSASGEAESSLHMITDERF